MRAAAPFPRPHRPAKPRGLRAGWKIADRLRASARWSKIRQGPFRAAPSGTVARVTAGIVPIGGGSPSTACPAAGEGFRCWSRRRSSFRACSPFTVVTREGAASPSGMLAPSVRSPVLQARIRSWSGSPWGPGTLIDSNSRGMGGIDRRGIPSRHLVCPATRPAGAVRSERTYGNSSPGARSPSAPMPLTRGRYSGAREGRESRPRTPAWGGRSRGRAPRPRPGGNRRPE